MTDFKTAFGRALDEQLKKRGTSQAHVATSIGVSPSYLNKTMHGYKSVSPNLVGSVSASLGLTVEEEVTLNRAAATDAGWKIEKE